MAVTIKDLSRKCGLSVSSVSKALNGYHDISPATRDAVEKAAREMGYFPNSFARALKTKRTYNLGILYSDDEMFGLTHAFFSMVLDSFKRASEERGYDVTFISHNIGKTRMTYLEHCLYRKLDGACIACIDFENSEVLDLAASSLPIITIDHKYANRSCIKSDNVGSMSLLLNHIYSLGHRRVAYIHGARSSVTNARLNAFNTAASALGLETPPEYIREGRYNSPTATRAQAEILLKLKNRPTCILAPDDYAALGLIEAIKAEGLSIPKDISIAGFDGIRMSQIMTPRLTTIRQDTEGLGREAASRLVKMIESAKGVSPETITVPCELIAGETVAAVSQ